MRKLHPEVHFGTEYIKLSSLPLNQMIHLKNWLSESSVFTMQSPDGSIRKCIYYEEYEFWFDNYKSENTEFEALLF